MILRPRLILRPSVGFHFFFFLPWSVLPRITWLPGGIPADIRHTLLTIMTTNNQRVNVRVRLGSWIISTVQKGGKSTLTGFCRIGVPEFPSKPEAAMPPTQFSHDYATGDCRAGSGGPLGRRTCSTWGFASWYQSFEREREGEKPFAGHMCCSSSRPLAFTALTLGGYRLVYVPPGSLDESLLVLFSLHVPTPLGERSRLLLSASRAPLIAMTGRGKSQATRPPLRSHVPWFLDGLWGKKKGPGSGMKQAQGPTN